MANQQPDVPPDTPRQAEATESPEPVVDPPELSEDDDTAGVDDHARRPARQWVEASQTAQLTLPSGASYNFSAGDVQLLQAEDAAFMVEQGYGARTGKPSEG